jgi:aspartate racemase
MTPSFSSIGILGGMGPEVTAEFYRRVIRIFQRQFGCRNDCDYPEIFIYNLPLPEVVSFVDDRAVQSLQSGIVKLEAMGPSFIVCPCNTASTFFSKLKFNVPYVCIFDAAIEKVLSKKVLILGTEQTIGSGEYQKRLSKKGKKYVVPSSEDQRIVTQVLLNILSGKKLFRDKMILKSIIAQTKTEETILGCTELPLLINGLALIDTVQSLAEATVAYSAKNYIKTIKLK